MHFKKNRLYLLAAIAVAMLAGCEKQQLPLPEPPEAGEKDKQEIQFRYFVEEGDRLIPYEDYLNAVAPPLPGPVSRAPYSGLPNGFRLFGIYTSYPAPDGKNGNYTISSQVERAYFNDSINPNGTNNPIHFWHNQSGWYHTFAAIAGFSSSKNILYQGLGSASNQVFIPVVSHTVAANPKEQTDLLLAYGPINVKVYESIPVVTIRFKHALSKLLFKVMATGGVTLYDCVLSIKYGENIASKERYYYTTDIYNISDGYWTPGNYYTTNYYAMNTPIIIPSTAVNQASAIDIGEMKQHSRRKHGDGWLELQLSYVKTLGASSIGLKTKMPAQELLPGMQYTYYLYVNEQLEQLAITDVTVEPWTTEIRVADPLN